MLAPDVTTAKQTLSAFATELKAVGTYASHLSDANFGPVEFDGAQVDLLADHPNLKANLASAQQHSTTFLEQNILLFALVNIYNFNSTFQNAAQNLIGLILNNGTNRQVAAALQPVLASLQTLQQNTKTQSTAMQTFSNQIGADFANLNSGADTISQGVQEVQNWVLQEGEAVEGGPGGSGLVQTIASIGSKMIARLQGFLTSVTSAAEDAPNAGESLGALLVVWETLIVKYQAVIQNLESAQGGGILAAGDVSSAQDGWNELAAYASSLLTSGSSALGARRAAGQNT
jgi:hypothetical protein